jgi:hypothetical protein
MKVYHHVLLEPSGFNVIFVYSQLCDILSYFPLRESKCHICDIIIVLNKLTLINAVKKHWCITCDSQSRAGLTSFFKLPKHEVDPPQLD